MIVKTRKFQLKTKKYIRLGLKNIFKEQWWVILIAIALASMSFVIPSVWWYIGAGIGYLLYILFWVIQFAGVTQLDQGKMLFEKLSYEIDSRQVLIKLSSKQGMPIKWENIKRAWAGKDHFVLVISKAQFIYLPHKVFNTENQIKFVETILRRKGYIK